MNTFQNEILSAIDKYCKEANICGELVYAIAKKSTDNGTTELYKEYNNAFELRGKYNGNSIDFGDSIIFRAYETVEDSVMDFVNYILYRKKAKNQLRYENLIGVLDPLEALKIFKEDGYNNYTDEYFDTLEDIINEILMIYQSINTDEEMKDITEENLNGINEVTNDEIETTPIDVEKEFVEEVVKEEPSKIKKTITIRKGLAIKLVNAPVYSTANTEKSSYSITGKYYIVENKTYNNRVRIVREESHIDAGRYLHLGFIKISDIR